MLPAWTSSSPPSSFNGWVWVRELWLGSKVSDAATLVCNWFTGLPAITGEIKLLLWADKGNAPVAGVARFSVSGRSITTPCVVPSTGTGMLFFSSSNFGAKATVPSGTSCWLFLCYNVKQITQVDITWFVSAFSFKSVKMKIEVWFENAIILIYPIQ